jgi:lysophospholipase L1-like esterase
MTFRTFRRWVLVAYVAALHLAFAVALIRPEAVSRRIHLLWPGPPAETISPFRLGMVEMQKRLDLTVRPGAIWFFGDSIIQMMDVGRVTTRAINLGIGEDTIGGVASRITDHPALADAGGIVIAVGVNDFWFRSATDAARGYARLLDRLPPGKPIIASAVLPVDERAGRAGLTGRNIQINSLNASISALCASHPACRFVDAGPSLADATGNLAASMHVGDGIHLNGLGYLRLIDTLRAAICDRMPCDG